MPKQGRSEGGGAGGARPPLEGFACSLAKRANTLNIRSAWYVLFLQIENHEYTKETSHFTIFSRFTRQMFKQKAFLLNFLNDKALIRGITKVRGQGRHFRFFSGWASWQLRHFPKIDHERKKVPKVQFLSVFTRKYYKTPLLKTGLFSDLTNYTLKIYNVYYLSFSLEEFYFFSNPWGCNTWLRVDAFNPSPTGVHARGEARPLVLQPC